MKFKSATDWKIFWLLFMLSEISMFGALPYSLSISGDIIYSFGVSIPMVLAAQFAQGTAFFALSIFTGLFLGKKIGLRAPMLESLFDGRGLSVKFGKSLKTSVFLGVSIGLFMFIADRFIYLISFDSLLVYVLSPPLWQRLMYSFYVCMVEEIILRFFLLTLLIWITWKIKKDSNGLPTKFGIYMSIISVSIIYGIGNIYSISSSLQLNNMIYAGTFIFNIISGIAFGWLYWKKGIEFAIISNLVATFMIFVVFASMV
jgi:hypothetical protein